MMIEKGIAMNIKGLTKYYGDCERPAVDNVSLSIPDASIFGLLGPNGAGKTSMIRILCGLLKPTSGEVFIKDFNLDKNLPEIKRIIGVVPQDIALYPSLTAGENLKIFGGICGLKGRELNERAADLLHEFGLYKSRNMKIKYYSGGMKRRLNLVAGLIHKPKILFLDEPTVGVDVQSKNLIVQSLLEINRGGTTILYTSHYLEEAENLCSDIAIIDEGKIIATGTLEEIKHLHKSGTSLEEVFLELTGKTLRD